MRITAGHSELRFANEIAAPLLDDSTAAARHTAIEEVLAQEQLTGAAWSLVNLDGEVRPGAAGFSDNVLKIPFTINTSVLTYLPDFEFGNPSARVVAGLLDSERRDAAQVTVRHLFDHTAGLDDARLW